MSIDMTSNDRAPSHRKPKLPPIADLAAMLRTGQSLEDVAAHYHRAGETLRPMLNQAGYTSSGDPMPADVVDLPSLGRLWHIPDWTIDALCAQTDPDSFFPEKGGSTKEAKATCRSCPVQVECVEYALGNEERFGVWGGLSERERRKILRADRPTTEQLHDLDEQENAS